MQILEARSVARCYRASSTGLRTGAVVRAVDGVSLSLARGETLGLVGESGCGKSTMGRLLLALESPDEGDVLFAGASLPPFRSTAWRALRARMQLVYQDPLAALDRRMTIGDQIREPLDIHEIGAFSDRQGRVESLLSSVGLSADFARRFPHEISGGQRQRVVLARALATAPDLLVCDEPVSALDVSIQAQVINLLVDIQSELKLSMVFISHDLKVVRQVSDRIAVMYLGRIVEEGDADTLFADPLHPYTQALVSAVPTPGQSGRRIILTGEPPNPAARPSGCAFHPRCSLATAMCRASIPALASVTGSRSVACHLVNAAIAA